MRGHILLLTGLAEVYAGAHLFEFVLVESVFFLGRAHLGARHFLNDLLEKEKQHFNKFFFEF
jgi:hypothetical protein